MAKNKTFIQGFQGLRGFAILLVTISHCNWALNEYDANILTYAGAWGVSCFIMLSGFLAVDRYYDTEFQLLSVWQIMKRKIKKCYPLHFLTFIIAVPLSAYAFTSTFGKMLCKAILNLTLTHTMIPVSGVYFSFNAVSWYLSLDVILVLFLPVMLFLLSKLRVKMVVYSIVFVAVLQVVVAMVAGQTSIAHWIVYICPVTRALDYFVGGGIALLVRELSYRKKNRYVWIMYCAMTWGILMIIFSMKTKSEIFLSSVWILPTSFVLIGIYMMRKGKNSFFTWKPLVFIGNISFEIFMFHQLVIRYCSISMSKLKLEITWWCYILMIIMSIAIAFAYKEHKRIYDWIKRRNE